MFGIANDAARLGANLVRLSYLTVFYLLVVGGGSVVAPLQASAQSTVAASVCSSPTSMEVASPISGVTVAEPTVEIKGYVHCLTQIRVYIDDVYNQTIPLDASATTFTVNVTIGPGAHTIKLVGVDIRQEVSPVANLAITYNPSAPVTYERPSEGSDRPVARESKSDTESPNLFAGLLGIPDTATKYLTEHPVVATLIDAAYGLLVTFGLVAPNTTHPLLPIIRFVVMIMGVVLLVGAYAIAGLVSRVMALRKTQLSTTPSRTAVVILRILGVLLLVTGLLIPS